MTADFTAAQRETLRRYQVDDRSRFVDVPSIGGRAHVLVHGDGPPVVMLNRIGTPAAMWAPLMARLGGFTLYAVDQPGFGLTDTSPRLTDDYRASAVRFLCEILDGLGLGHAPFVANSLGSLWTTWLALDEPDRVDAMAHVGCPALAPGTSAPLPMRLLSLPGLGRVMMRLQPPSPKQVEGLSKMVREHPLPPEIAGLLVATGRLPGYQPTFLATLRTLLRLRGPRPGPALSVDDLARLTQPTLLVWGEDDPMGAPAAGARAAAVIPECSLHVVPGGHAPWLTQADRIAPVVTSHLTRYIGRRAAE